MNILIVYATNSSSTEEASELVRDALLASGHTVRLQRAEATQPDDFSHYDGLVFASCTWGRQTPAAYLDGQLQEDWFALKERCAGKTFSEKPIAVLAIGDSRYTKFAAAGGHLEALIGELHARQLGTTLHVDGYYFHLPENRQAVSTWSEKIGDLFRAIRHA